MSKETVDILVKLMDALKSEIDEIEESIERLTYKADNTKNIKELNAINNELGALQQDLVKDFKELKTLLKKYNSAIKK